MAFTTAGLANGGVTTHYRFQYDDSLKQSATNPYGPEPVRTNLVVVACDRFMSLFKVTGRATVLGQNGAPALRQTSGAKTGMTRAPVFHRGRRVNTEVGCANAPRMSPSVVPGTGQMAK